MERNKRSNREGKEWRGGTGVRREYIKFVEVAEIARKDAVSFFSGARGGRAEEGLER